MDNVLSNYLKINEKFADAKLGMVHAAENNRFINQKILINDKGGEEMKKLLGCFLCVMLLAFGAQAFALTINDSGVVGTIEAGTQSSDVANEIDWANYLLSLPVSSTLVIADGNTPTDNVTENYLTSSTDYNAILTGGTQIQGATPNVSGYEYVLGKYDGQNAGYVLFNMSVFGGSSIPQFSHTIWTDNTEKYELSHATGFSVTSVPDASVMLLLGSSFLVLAVFGKKRKTI